MHLRSGVPYWPAAGIVGRNYPSLKENLSTDVVVLGGGITGALIAHQLAKNRIACVLLDRGTIGRGSTTASTGLLQYEIDTPLVELIGKVGEQHAAHAYRRGLRAIKEIEELTRELGDDCGFVFRDSLYFASHWWHQWRLKSEYECRRTLGFDVDYLSRKEVRAITSIDSVGAIRSRGDAQIDPLRFTLRLMDAASDLGLQAFAGTAAVTIAEQDHSVHVQSEHGSVQAKQVVYAIGYDVREFLHESIGNFNSTYALCSQPNLRVPGWPDDCLIWETARPYFYARRTSDGRAMIGGADTAFSNDHKRDQLLSRQTEKLIKRFNQLFPEASFQPDYSWAGTFAETKDGLAYIGQRKGRPRAYFALGYGGNGITFSMIAAKLIHDLIAGRPNDDAAVFSFER